MNKVIIQNCNTELILSFDTEIRRNLMIKAISNCINYPFKFQSIDYRDNKDHIILTAEYLKNSLIRIPKL